MARYIGLIVAPKRQRAGIRRASDSYAASPLFRRARDYCVRHHDEWYVLSARHALLTPQQVIGDGELAWSGFSPTERRQWARQTATLLQERCARDADTIIFVLYGPRQYAQTLKRAVPSLQIELPLAGLTARERARWFDERLRVAPRRLISTQAAPPAPAPTPEAVAPTPARSFWRLRKPHISAALSLVGSRGR